MFFILSKILAYLILPVTLLALLLLITLLARNRKVKQLAFILFCGLFFLFTNPFLANQLMRWWEISAMPIEELAPDYEAAIILTGVTALDQTPSDRVHLQKGADRIMHTVQLYKLGKFPLIVVSGGTGKLMGEEGPTEAENIKKVLLISGVPENDILLEEESRNTYENALNTARILKEKNIPTNDLLLVTSAFHMRRSLACFRQAGLSPTPYSTDFYSSEPAYTPEELIIPSEGALVSWTKLVREWVGYLMYDIMGYL